MKVVMVEPGQYARIEEMDTGLESLQKAVGGLIDCAYPWEEMVCIVCNDEGLLNGMPLNRNVENYQPIAGPFFVCGIEGEDFCSLTDEQAQRYQAMFHQPELGFCSVPDLNMIMLVKYGQPGYWPIEHFPEGMGAEEYADTLNQMIGVSKPQQTAMLYGSMFGWIIPAASPERFDENGKPKPHGQRRGNPER